MGIIVKEFSSVPVETNKTVDLFNQHAHNRTHKLGSQVCSYVNFIIYTSELTLNNFSALGSDDKAMQVLVRVCASSTSNCIPHRQPGCVLWIQKPESRWRWKTCGLPDVPVALFGSRCKLCWAIITITHYLSEFHEAISLSLVFHLGS